jgi:predicted O-methyltransferase YrrM
MILQGSRDKLKVELARLCPNAPALPNVKRQMLDYQMAALYSLARAYDRKGARILEIGTGHGGSGYMLAKAAPQAAIVSLTTNPAEGAVALRLWRESGCRNITAIVEASATYFGMTATATWDMVFVDGDHNRIARDLPWFNRLSVGGLFLCHDYSPKACPIVYNELNGLAAKLGRQFDVILVDSDDIGMVGLRRRDGETA